MASRNSLQPWVYLLIGMYFPVLVGACAVALLCGILLISAGREHHRLIAIPFFTLPAILLFVMILHVLISLRALFIRLPDDEMEIVVPKRWIRWLYELVADVSKSYKVPRPDEIRLHAVSVAHVYENEERRKILVVGGLALAGLTDKALSGVIAHELGHFAAGDTVLGRIASKWMTTFALMEAHFHFHWASNLNPLVWVLRGYHLLFRLVFFANSRSAEYAADKYEIEHVGPVQAARTTILLSAIDELADSQLLTVAQTCVAARVPAPQVFSEQARRIRETSPSDWADAFRRALKQRTRAFDSHPCLKDRLKATGLSKKKCLRLARQLNQEGEPACDLVNNWPAIEKVLSDRIVAVVQAVYNAKMEMAQLVLGRPVT